MNRTSNITSYLAILLLGVLFGWFFWGAEGKQTTESKTTGDAGHDMFTVMAEANKNLVGKFGNAFDIAFLDHMIIHQQGAIDAANLALQNSEHEEIRKLAKDIIIYQTVDIEKMKIWQKEWYYSN